MNLLDQMKKFTTIVADTGDFDRMKTFAPQDATTNPTLILRAAQMPAYAHLIDEVKAATKDMPIHDRMDQLLVRFGMEILNIIPGRVSTEIDAELSFDIEDSVARARKIMDLYQANGVDKSRVLIKIAATWEGIQSARILENEGIHCNLTLVFCLAQAVACADAKVTLISPFVGRITDWYKHALAEKWNDTQMSGLNDPGVKSVTTIYNYLKHYDFKTQIMGASFRNVEQVTALAGCDFLTISPELLEKLQSSTGEVKAHLEFLKAKNMAIEELQVDEKIFRTLLNDDPMATEKLAEGIRNFKKDTVTLTELLSLS
jgi:transaldolase